MPEIRNWEWNASTRALSTSSHERRTSTANLGAVISVRGSVVDVRFDERFPPTHHAIECFAAEEGLYFGESTCKAYMRDGPCDAKRSVSARCTSQTPTGTRFAHCTRWGDRVTDSFWRISTHVDHG